MVNRSLDLVSGCICLVWRDCSRAQNFGALMNEFEFEFEFNLNSLRNQFKTLDFSRIWIEFHFGEHRNCYKCAFSNFQGNVPANIYTQPLLAQQQQYIYENHEPWHAWDRITMRYDAIVRKEGYSLQRFWSEMCSASCCPLHSYNEHRAKPLESWCLKVESQSTSFLLLRWRTSRLVEKAMGSS